LYFHFGGLHHDPNPGKRSLVQEGGRWVWALRKSILCAVYVIMCGNIGMICLSTNVIACKKFHFCHYSINNLRSLLWAVTKIFNFIELIGV